MQEVQPGWKEVAAITWLLIWRGALGGFAIGFVLGLIVNLVMGFAFGKILGSQLNLSIGLIIALVWWPLVVRMALGKRYRGFRIALVPA